MADGNMDTDKERVEEERRPTPEENPRNARFKEIAEAEVKEDMVDVADEAHDATTPVEDEVPAPEPTVQKYKIKVNGVEEEVTLEEMQKRAELAGGAEAKFQEAARLRKEAEELRKQPPEKDAAATEVEDPRALARALQMGSEDEAAAVIQRLLVRPSREADVSVVDQRIEFRESAKWFQQNYEDIVTDPYLRKLALDEDEEMVKKGDRRPYQERYKEIGEKLRTWRGTGTKSPTVAAKTERKANLQVVPSASVRAEAPKQDDDGPSDQEFIAREAKRRGQGYVLNK